MVCEKCRSKQIIWDDNRLICPQCENLNILSKNSALQICQKRSDWFNRTFDEIINGLEKKLLILHLLLKREKVITQFFETASINLRELLALNYLIKKGMEYYDIDGKEKVNKNNIEELINHFAEFIEIQSSHSLIKEDFGYLIAKEAFDPDKIGHETLMSNFKFVLNEDWFSVSETYEQNLIMTDEKTKEYLEKHKEEYEAVKNKQNSKLTTPKEKIRILYPTFLSLRAGLIKNSLFYNIFNPDYLSEKNIHIDIFLRLMKHFERKPGNLNSLPSRTFKRLLRKEFTRNEKTNLYNALVFNEKNQNIFPLYLELDKTVYISLDFTYFMYLFYYSFYYNDLFDQETQRLSGIFEKKIVPETFRKNGFDVVTNITDKPKNPTLEIDSMAFKNNLLYIVETKMWNIKAFYEHKKIHEFMKRDLKGIVDGKKYTTKDSELTPKNIPSLLSKIQYVEDNTESLCPKHHENITETRGLIITKSYPPINLYKNIEIITLDEIKNLK
jgi:hypothetical protein